MAAEIQERPSDKAPTPKTEEELIGYVREMAAWPESATEPGEGYGRCVYSLAYGALATFNYLASALGVTGFQASCADMEIIAQSRGMKNGMMILNGHDLLYPQYDLAERAAAWIAKTQTHLAPEARRLLAEADAPGGMQPHPAVRAHWEWLATLTPAAEGA